MSETLQVDIKELNEKINKETENLEKSVISSNKSNYITKFDN